MKFLPVSTDILSTRALMSASLRFKVTGLPTPARRAANPAATRPGSCGAGTIQGKLIVCRAGDHRHRYGSDRWAPISDYQGTGPFREKAKDFGAAAQHPHANLIGAQHFLQNGKTLHGIVDAGAVDLGNHITVVPLSRRISLRSRPGRNRNPINWPFWHSWRRRYFPGLAADPLHHRAAAVPRRSHRSLGRAGAGGFRSRFGFGHGLDGRQVFRNGDGGRAAVPSLGRFSTSRRPWRDTTT